MPNETVLVTGAAKRIGRGIARQRRRGTEISAEKTYLVSACLRPSASQRRKGSSHAE